jgi:hypothetical protein
MSVQDNIDQQKLSFIRESRRLLGFFQNPAWCASAELTDEEHVEEFRQALAKTREHTSLPDRTKLNSVRDTESGLVLSLVGNTPSAEERAKFINGILLSMPRILDEFEENLDREERINELLASNSEKLLENRAQRQTIVSLQAREKWLLEKLSEMLVSPADSESMPVVE